MDNEKDYNVPMTRDSKTFDSGPSSSFEAPRPQAGASGQRKYHFDIVPLGPAYRAGLARHFPVTGLGVLPRYTIPCFFKFAMGGEGTGNPAQ